MKWLIMQLFTAAAVLAQPQQSESFRITKSVLDAGGGACGSEDFQLVSAFGQPTPIGRSTSENFRLYAGFLSPSFSVSPLSPIQRLVIQRVGSTTNMRLKWEPISGAVTYHIYRDTNPLFTPGPGNALAITTDTTLLDVGAVSLPATKYYYLVTVSNELTPSGVVVSQMDEFVPGFESGKTMNVITPVVKPAAAAKHPTAKPGK